MKFTLMCYIFDIALVKFLVLLITLFIVVECYSSRECASMVFCLSCLSTACGE